MTASCSFLTLSVTDVNRDNTPLALYASQDRPFLNTQPLKALDQENQPSSTYVLSTPEEPAEQAQVWLPTPQVFHLSWLQILKGLLKTFIQKQLEQAGFFFFLGGGGSGMPHLSSLMETMDPPPTKRHFPWWLRL